MVITVLSGTGSKQLVHGMLGGGGGVAGRGGAAEEEEDSAACLAWSSWVGERVKLVCTPGYGMMGERTCSAINSNDSRIALARSLRYAESSEE